MKPATPISPFRREARSIIAKVIEDNVLGHPHLLPHGDVLELRRKLRKAYPFGQKQWYPYRVWCEEVRHALGYPLKPPSRSRRQKPIPISKIMPCMVEWARLRRLVE